MTSHLKTYFTHRQSLALGAVFISIGFLFGNWATLIPFVKQKFALDDAELGLLLLCLPFGAGLFNPVSTILINKIGMKNTTIGGILYTSLVYCIPMSASNIALVGLGLFLIGTGIAITNVAMNTCVTALEHQEGISIISTSHGMFSVGLMLGSFIASFMIGLGIQPNMQMYLMSFSVIILTFYNLKRIMSIKDEKITESEGDSKFSFPKGALLMMVLVSLCVNITEGTMADWTAVYMRDVVETNPYFIGWGLAGYSMFMAAGRLLGDSLAPQYGANNVIKIGGIIAAAGLVLAVTLPYTATSIIGFAMVGAGVSCGAPILYGAAARVPNMAPGAGLAIMNTFSIFGFLAGPVVIGFISKAINLPFAFLVIATLACLWSYLVTKVKLY
ncbi:MAG: MFS transporter [Spirosomataceae bacterium]